MADSHPVALLDVFGVVRAAMFSAAISFSTYDRAFCTLFLSMAEEDGHDLRALY